MVDGGEIPVGERAEEGVTGFPFCGVLNASASLRLRLYNSAVGSSCLANY